MDGPAVERTEGDGLGAVDGTLTGIRVGTGDDGSTVGLAEGINVG